MSASFQLLQGHVLDRLRELPDESVHCCVTSPPYWGLRDYGVVGQIGLEPTHQEYIANVVEVFRQVKRVLRSDGTAWVNMGDSYAGNWRAQSRSGSPSESSTLKGNGHFGGGPKIKSLSAVQIANHAHRQSKTGSKERTPGIKTKDMCGTPWRLAFALQDDGWYLRQDIIWHKPNPMPESIVDRCTKAHEYVFLLSKSARYYYDADAIRTPFSEETKDLSFDTMDYSRRDKYVSGWANDGGSHSAIAHAKPKSHNGSKFTDGKTAHAKKNLGQGPRKDNPRRIIGDQPLLNREVVSA
jgi:hypothetical protein